MKIEDHVERIRLKVEDAVKNALDRCGITADTWNKNREVDNNIETHKIKDKSGYTDLLHDPMINCQSCMPGQLQWQCRMTSIWECGSAHCTDAPRLGRCPCTEAAATGCQ